MKQKSKGASSWIFYYQGELVTDIVALGRRITPFELSLLQIGLEIIRLSVRSALPKVGTSQAGGVQPRECP